MNKPFKTFNEFPHPATVRQIAKLALAMGYCLTPQQAYDLWCEHCKRRNGGLWIPVETNSMDIYEYQELIKTIESLIEEGEYDEQTN